MARKAAKTPPSIPVESARGEVWADASLSVPSESWGRDELHKWAVDEYHRVKGERKDAAAYWPLGKALRLVRRGFNKDRGAWTRWRKARGIDRSRSQRAVLFARAFRKPDKLRGMSIAKATKLANQRLGIEPRQSEVEARLRRWLQSVTKTAQERLGEVTKVQSRDSLLPLVDELGDLVAQLRSACGAAPRHPK